MSLQMLENVLGSGQKRQEYEDFVNRYDQGEPHEGISDDEAASRYQEVTSQLNDDDYESSAREAFERMSPDHRRELAQVMRQQGAQHVSGDEADSGQLARAARQIRQQQPGGLAALLGGGGGGGGGSGIGGLLANPAVKSALAGVAAIAAKKAFSR